MKYYAVLPFALAGLLLVSLAVDVISRAGKPAPVKYAPYLEPQKVQEMIAERQRLAVEKLQREKAAESPSVVSQLRQDQLREAAEFAKSKLSQDKETPVRKRIILPTNGENETSNEQRPVEPQVQRRIVVSSADLERYDLDHDGKLDKDELATRAKVQAEEMKAREVKVVEERRKWTLNRYDYDHDGRLNDDELHESLVELPKFAEAAAKAEQPRRRVVLATNAPSEPGEGRRRVALPTNEPTPPPATDGKSEGSLERTIEDSEHSFVIEHDLDGDGKLSPEEAAKAHEEVLKMLEKEAKNPK